MEFINSFFMIFSFISGILLFLFLLTSIEIISLIMFSDFCDYIKKRFNIDLFLILIVVILVCIVIFNFDSFIKGFTYIFHF